VPAKRRQADEQGYEGDPKRDVHDADQQPPTP
jgi:hypothetical protein